ncbi:MAG: sugar phosphate nucleotidyltransferase [Promethearchaeota archaeon]
MKFVVPMAGAGTRLRPFTFSKPKGFFKVAGKRLIDHILDKFKQSAMNSSDLLIITGSQERAIKNYLESEYSSFFNITFESQIPKGYHGNIPYFGGLGQAIYLSEKWYESKISSYESDDPEDYAIINLNDMLPLAGYSDFVSLLCGEEFSQQLENRVDDFKDNDDRHSITQTNLLTEVDGVIGIMKVPKSRISSYGIVTVDSQTGFIKSLVEKPIKSSSNLAITGVYGFKPKTMKNLYKFLKKEVKKFEGKEGEAQLTPAIQDLVTNGFKLAPMEFSKGILDFGKYDTLLEGNKFLLTQQDNILGDLIGEISNSSLNSPSFIGKNVRMKNCVIGPYCSIGDNCVLHDCIVRNSVIGDGCYLEKIITKNSIIGDHVIMDDIIKDDMIIGDQSNIRSSKNHIANSG